MLVNRRLTGILVITLLLLTACGAQSDSNEVTITLTDFGMESSRTSFEVGVPHHFTVTNNGAINHEIMIMAPLTEDQMMMNMGMEEMDEMGTRNDRRGRVDARRDKNIGLHIHRACACWDA